MSVDLVLLTPDVDIGATLRAILGRSQALGIRPVSVEEVRSPQRDPGVFHGGPDLLRPFLAEASRALAVLDCNWSGSPAGGEPGVLVRELEARLSQDWDDRAKVVAIDPEVEVWVWSDSPELEAVLDWPHRPVTIRGWLEERGRWPLDAGKPPNPKQAFIDLCRECRRPASAALFRAIAQRVSLHRCTDPSFIALKETLRGWFAVD